MCLLTAFAALSGRGQDSLPDSELSPAEEQAHEVVERAYLEVLERHPDEQGLATYVDALLTGGKDEAWLKEALRNSPEGRRVAHRRKVHQFRRFALIAIPLVMVALLFMFRRGAKDFVFKLFLVLVGAAAACLIAEVVLRAKARYDDVRNARAWQDLGSRAAPRTNEAALLQDIIRPSADTNIIYELRPSLDVRFMGGRLTTGPDGLRQTPCRTPGEKPFTIVGLGDSVMFGWGVSDEETYLSVLCEWLNHKHPDVGYRSINTAVPGYNTVMEVAALKAKGLGHSPNLVLIHFVGNDLYLPNFILAKDTRVRLTGSYLLEALSRWSGGNLRTRQADFLVRTPGDVPDACRWMIGETACRAALQELAALSRKLGFKLALIANDEPPAFVGEEASRLAIPMLILEPALYDYLREHPMPELTEAALRLSRRDPHFSPLGHQLVAEILLGFLTDHGLL